MAKRQTPFLMWEPIYIGTHLVILKVFLQIEILVETLQGCLTILIHFMNTVVEVEIIQEIAQNCAT